MIRETHPLTLSKKLYRPLMLYSLILVLIVAAKNRTLRNCNLLQTLNEENQAGQLLTELTVSGINISVDNESDE